MFRTALPKILIIIAICVCPAAQAAFGQAKKSGEVDVTKCWAYPIAEEASKLGSDGVRVYIGGSGAKIEALSVDGKKMWATELGGEISSNLLSTDAGLFLVTATVADKEPSSNVLRSLSRDTGITNWTAKMPDAGEHFIGTYKDSIVVVSKNGVIQSLDAKSGSPKWKREIAEGFAARPAFGKEKAIVASTGKQVFVISLASGEIDLMRKIPLDVSAVGQSGYGDVVVGDELGNTAFFVGAAEKTYWKFRSGGEISAIFSTGSHDFITSHANFAYYLSQRSGSVAWKKRLSGRVSQIAMYADRFVIITSFEDHGAVLLDLATGKVAGQIALTADETVTHDPVISDGLIFMLTNRAAYAFSLSGCPAKKDGGPDLSSKRPPL